MKQKPEPKCARCNDSGLIGVSTDYRCVYRGPGPVPEDARGVTEAYCDECGEGAAAAWADYRRRAWR